MQKEPAETWRPIPDYEGLYEASDQGRVRSLPRVYMRRNGRPLPAKGRVLKGGSSGGYMTVVLSKGGEHATFRIHRAVMLAFVGPLPDGMVTRHLNGNPLDNRLANLEYGSPAENVQDAIGHGTQYLYNLQTSKTCCPLGHELSDPNLVKSHLPKRKCKSCDLARRRVAYNPARDLVEEADGQYRRIMAGETGPTPYVKRLSEAA